MADLSDVTAYIAQAASAAVYPNGTAAPSVAAMDCRVYEGWPLADQLDLDLAGNTKDVAGNVGKRAGGPVANISIFPMPGTGVAVYQILDETYTVTPVTFGLSVSVSGNVITVSGQPHSGEYLTLVCDRANVFSLSATTTQGLLNSLAVAAQAIYPTANATATTLTVPFKFHMDVRQGGVATLGKVTHRQRQCIMVTVWAPNRVVRNQLAAAIDVALKINNKITLPDTSQAILTYSRTLVNDQNQSDNVYRRDLMYDVEYATLDLFPGYVVTSANVTIAKPDNTAIANAIT